MTAYGVGGKVALVTGGAQGIGYEAARRLHDRGAAVVLADVDRERVEQAAASLGSDRALALRADVRDLEAMQAAVAAAVKRFDGLDVVVANAGIAPRPATMSACEPAVFNTVLDINLAGVCNTVWAALPEVKSRRGHVVIVASVYAFLNGMMATPYAMSKAAVEQLGRALRVELAPHGASATVAYFGFVDTGLVRDAFQHPLAQQLEEALPALMFKRITPGRAGEAIVRGIERRAPRVIAPRWFAGFSALRGILNPLLDRRLARDEKILEIVRRGDRPVPAETRPPAEPR